MNTNQINRHLDSFYDALATNDNHAQEVEAENIFDLMLDDLIYNSPDLHFCVSSFTKTHDINTLLDAYQNRVQSNTDAWTEIEAEIMSEIGSYHLLKHIEFENKYLNAQNLKIEFIPLKVKAVIDWLDLTFEVDPNICSFANKPNARSYIKSFLTSKTGTKHYVKHDESEIHQNGFTFTIRLHDIHNKEDLHTITALLIKQYGAKYDQMKVSSIELALDFYNAPSRAFLSALHKSIKYSKTSENFRIYKYVKKDIRNKFTPIPKSPFTLLECFNNDWCLGVNPKGSPLCYRLYAKTTDSNKKPLPDDKHRLRVEVTLNSDFLMTTDHYVSDLRNIIKLGFKYLTFTKLAENASEEMKIHYRREIIPFGKEHEMTSKSRNKRDLANGIKTNSELNSLVSKSVLNQCRSF